MDTAKSQVAFWIAATVTIVWIAYLALAAAEHEQELNLGPDCTIYEDGSATCLDDQGGWHFEEGTF